MGCRRFVKYGSDGLQRGSVAVAEIGALAQIMKKIFLWHIIILRLVSGGVARCPFVACCLAFAWWILMFPGSRLFV
jgi:hypothetical protein